MTVIDEWAARGELLTRRNDDSPLGTGRPAGLPGFAYREYQTDAVETIIEKADAGVMRQLVSLPTGSGKTVIFSLLLSRLKRKALVVAHRDELLEQAQQKIPALCPDASIGIVKGDREELGADIVISGIQTVRRRLSRFKHWHFDTLIIDEAHHAAADSYRAVIDGLNPRLAVGFTATAYRADSRALGDVFSEVVFERSILEMIEDGYLCDARGISVRTDFDISNVRTEHGDFITAELALAIDLPERNEMVAKNFISQLPAGTRAICFCANVAHAQHMADTFSIAGVPTAAVWGEMDPNDRRRTLNAFRDGRYQVLTNCAVLTEGFDEPSISAIVLARPTKSRSLYVQMVGRGLRPYVGKDLCTVLDFHDNTGRHSLCTMSELMGEGGGQVKDGETIKQATARARHEQEIAQRGLIEITTESAETVDLFHRSPNCWVPFQSSFILSAGRQRFTLTPNANGRYLISGREGNADMNISTREWTLNDALSAVDRAIAKDNVMSHYSRKDAEWRLGPATPKQLTAMKKLGMVSGGGITAGQASLRILMKQLENEKRRTEPATDKQLRYLAFLGVTIPTGCSRGMAGVLISRAKWGGRKTA